MTRKKASNKTSKNSRNGKSKYSRYSRNEKVEIREIKERFLIVCEGTQTEPNYFKSFRVPKDVIDVRGFGKNTISLVKEAVRIKEEDNDYDRVWCVFDRDSFPVKNFNQAIKYAEDNDIAVAYSNEAFELWYLLHFDYRDTAMSREEYKDALTKRMNKEYKKNSKTIYDDLKTNQSKAIKNAERLLEQYNPRKPANDNPSTTVHLLVQELKKFVK